MDRSRPASMSRESSTSCEKILYILIFCVGLLVQFVILIFSSDDCRGPGAAYPGGCPDFRKAFETATLYFFLLEFLILVLLLFAKVKLSPSVRLFILLIYSSIVLFGYPLIFVLLQSLKTME